AVGVALVVGTGTYYVAMVAISGGGSLGYAVVVGVAWGAAALFIGAAFGLAGGLWRGRDDLLGTAAAALLAGALVGEAVVLTAV
ncbi:MAG: hypothetical protein JHC95_18505, partial [Solirubrobacteraceae bacterium]|nr:hypothetical protein [Solirubrobacteraceae bacterium]